VKRQFVMDPLGIVGVLVAESLGMTGAVVGGRDIACAVAELVGPDNELARVVD
jgi:hypothetical protein